MPAQLPSAIASAIEAARVVYEADKTPRIPFVARQPEPVPTQAPLFGVAPPPTRLSWDEWLDQLLAHARPVLQYLGLGHQELRDAAQRLPGELYELSHAEPFPGFAARAVAAAERKFGEPVPGATLDAQARRVGDAKYWRRFLVKRVRQARELLHIQLGLVGSAAQPYCSAEALAHRRTQLENQAQWLKDTKLRAVIDGELVELPLENIAKTARQKLARVYAFVRAMDQLGKDAGLRVALLTTTLEGKWHARPKTPNPQHRWSGATPAEANAELGARFQNVRRDLDKLGIKLSGLWAGEPHESGCLHRHHWLLYDPKHEHAIFAAFMTYFPRKLKLRRAPEAGGDVVFTTRGNAARGVSRPLRKDEGAQVDVSVIDPKKGSGASYVLKYVAKAILPDLSEAELGTLLHSREFPRELVEERPARRPVADAGEPEPTQAEKLKASLATLAKVDAHRANWRVRSFQFFGIKNCLSLWDELRRMKQAPAEPHLRELWRLARGGEAEGSITAERQRGDAKGFLQALGGLAAAPTPEQLELGTEAASDALKARIYTEPTTTRYGEMGARIKGVELVQRLPRRRKRKGEAPAPTEELLERIETRTVRWELVPKDSTSGETTGSKVGAAAPGKGRTSTMTNRQPPAPGAEAPGDS